MNDSIELLKLFAYYYKARDGLVQLPSRAFLERFIKADISIRQQLLGPRSRIDTLDERQIRMSDVSNLPP